MSKNNKPNCEKATLMVNYPLGCEKGIYPLFVESLDCCCLCNVQVHEHSFSFPYEKDPLGSY